MNRAHFFLLSTVVPLISRHVRAKSLAEDYGAENDARRRNEHVERPLHRDRLARKFKHIDGRTTRRAPPMFARLLLLAVADHPYSTRQAEALARWLHLPTGPCERSRHRTMAMLEEVVPRSDSPSSSLSTFERHACLVAFACCRAGAMRSSDSRRSYPNERATPSARVTERDRQSTAQVQTTRRCRRHRTTSVFRSVNNETAANLPSVTASRDRLVGL